MEKVITIGIGSGKTGPLAEDLEMAEEADAEMMESIAPRGTFTSRGLDPLVKSVNMILPLFDQSPDYPKVADTDVLPTDFVRILSMISAATADAVGEERINPEMEITLDGIRDDTGLMSLSGKIQMLAKDKSFKAFLKEPMKEPKEEVMEEEEEEMGQEEMDSLMMERM